MKYIKCFDCGDYIEVKDTIKNKSNLLYKGECIKCGSITTSTHIECDIDLDSLNEGLRRGMIGGTPGETCEHCKLTYGKEGHDACLGTLAGVMNACCGHGDINSAYVQFSNGECVYGADAISVQEELKQRRDTSIKEHYYSCCIDNCEYNYEKQCCYCGDYWTLNSKDCISFEEREE